jgi:hypothetical protein
MADDNGYPRVLDKTGCIYGQHISERVDEVDEKVKGIEKKIDKLTAALVGAAITFGTAAVMLALNLLTR